MHYRTNLIDYVFTFLFIIGVYNAVSSVSSIGVANTYTYLEKDQYKVEILRWVDGDTAKVDINLGLGVWLREQTIRLSEVNTPERGQKDYEKATRMSNTVCPDKAIATITTKDKYGRWLAQLTCDGVDLNNSLINYGWRYTSVEKNSSD